MRTAAVARKGSAVAAARGALLALLIAAAGAGGSLSSAPDAAAAPPDAGQRALIALLPTEPAPKHPLLGEFAARGMAVGLTSPTLGGYSPRQMMLDVSQGTRISTRAYSDALPVLTLVSDAGRGRIGGWEEAVERAGDASDELVPGLLADTVRRARGRVAYAGVLGFEQLEAFAAANRAGRIQRVELSTIGAFADRAAELWRESDVLVARLPADARGLEALDRLLAERRPADLVYAMRAPPGGKLRLLATGVAGPGFSGRLRSETTRRLGLVAAPDVAPTVLDHLGIEVPDEMQGRRVESTDARGADRDAQAVRELAARLDVVTGRRDPTLRALVATIVAVLAGFALAGGRSGLRTGLRIVFVGGLWLPGLTLLTGALEPSRDVEVLALALGSATLGAATDRLLPWPAAPALPAAASLCAFAIDLAAGSPLTAVAISGPNPKGGARYYGIGNELEAILALSALLGAGAALTLGPPRWAARGFALTGLVTAAVIGAGRLGADVGGVVTVAAGTAVAVLSVLAARGRRPSWRAIAVAVAVPAVAVLVLFALDVATGGGAHLTRSVTEADDPGELVEIAERRLRISFSGIDKGTTPISITIALALLAAGALRRDRLLAPARDAPELGAGMAGALTATLVGALANDSGPLILLIGTAFLLLAAGYVWGRPERSRVAAAPP
jgi:hypothetical protein